jgi:hypothetical protein
VPHLSPKLAAHGVTLDTRLFDEDAHGDMTIGAYVWRPPGAAA